MVMHGLVLTTSLCALELSRLELNVVRTVDQAGDCQATAESESGKQPLHELGVLFIHGIGEQARGDTLLGVAEPFYEWVRRWTEGARQDAEPGPDNQSPHDPPVDLVSVAFNQKDTGVPPNATIRVSLTPSRGEKPRPVTWLFAESHWAQSFPQPSFAEVTGWSMRAVPWVLASFLGRRMHMAWLELRPPDKAGAAGSGGAGPAPTAESRVSSSVSSRMMSVARLLGHFIMGLIVAPLAFVVDLLLFLLLLLYGIPLTSLRSYLELIHAKISAVIGDSYAFTESHFRREAVISQVSGDLQWLEGQCDKVVVMAHSQGAAVAYLVLGRHPSPKLTTLITFGSGLLKLTQLSAKEMPLPKWTTRFSVFAIFLGDKVRSLDLLDGFAILTACSVLQLAFGIRLFFTVPSDSQLPASLQFTYLVWFENWYFLWVRLVTPLCGVLMMVGVFLAGTLEDLTEIGAWARNLATKAPNFKWFDYYASADPVPNGPLFLNKSCAPPMLHSVPVRNLESMLFDHTSYAQNTDEFISAAAREALRNSTIAAQIEHLTPHDQEALSAAAPLRRDRLLRRRIDKWLMLAFLTLLLSVPTLQDVGDVVSRWFREMTMWGARVVYGNTIVPGNPFGLSNLFFGGLTIVTIYFVALAVFNSLWRLGERFVEDSFFSRFTKSPFFETLGMLVAWARHGIAVSAASYAVYGHWPVILRSVNRAVPIGQWATLLSPTNAAFVFGATVWTMMFWAERPRASRMKWADALGQRPAD